MSGAVLAFTMLIATFIVAILALIVFEGGKTR